MPFFFTHAREAVNYHHERNPSDPRTTRTVTLETDQYGNVLRSITIGYGRRSPNPDVPPTEQALQARDSDYVCGKRRDERR
ncbi:toxin TcdB middle/C-terminal domain-containing protein [Streptomyces sp. L7]